MDLRKQKDSAAALFSKGKFAKSAEAYEAYCKVDPKDLQAKLRMGDAWAKAGQKDKAIHAYHATAEGFAKDGFLPRAIAAAKLVLELDPSHTGVQKMLADLYARKGGAKPKTTEVPAVTRGVMSAERAPTAAAPAKAPLKDEKPAAPRGKHDPIELPPDEPPAPPASQRVDGVGSGATASPYGKNAIELPPDEPPAPKASQRMDGVGSGAMAPEYGKNAIELPPDDGAIEIETTSAPRPAPVEAKAPPRGVRAIDLPPDDGPMELEGGGPSSAPTGPKPAPSLTPQEIELDVGAPPAEAPSEIEVEVGGASADGAVEIELAAGQPVTGEVEVPIMSGEPIAEPAPSAPPPPPPELEIEVAMSPPSRAPSSRPPPPPPSDAVVAGTLVAEPEAVALPGAAAPRVAPPPPGPVGARARTPEPEAVALPGAASSRAAPPPLPAEAVNAEADALPGAAPSHAAPPPLPAEAVHAQAVVLPGAAAEPIEISQPRTVRLGEAAPEPVVHPDTIVLRAPRLPPIPAPPAVPGLSLDDELAAAEPELPSVALPPRSSPSASTLPPGLRPKRAESPEPPRASPSRLWLPPQVTGASAAPPAPLPPPPSIAPVHAPAPITRDAPLTDLERSLEAFSRFDEFEAVSPLMGSRPPPSPPPPLAAKPAKMSFTELDLEGDSLLHAVEAAAESSSGAAAVLEAEELLDTPDDGKAEPGALPKIPLFSDLPEDAFIALFEQCPLRRFQKGEVIIDQGSHGTSFFVICAGRVRVFRTDEKGRHDLATLEEGTFFGEMAFLSDAPRSASVEAFDDDETQALEISAEILASLSRKHPTVAAALKKFYRQRLLSNLMNSAKLFQVLNKADRRTLVARFKARDVPKGEVLIKEGAPSDGLYVVLSGAVDVVVKNRAVAALKEGDVFGEMSLLTRSPASATVRSSKRTSLLRLPVEDFNSLIMVHPEILTLVAELSDSRTRANATLAKPSTATAEMV